MSIGGVKIKSIVLNKDKLIQKHDIEGLSQKDIAKYFGVSIDTVVKNLKNYGIKTHKSNYHAHEQKIFLNEIQKDYLDGAMLGDGCLYKNKNCKNSQFIYTSKSYQHVKYVSMPFEHYLYKEGIKYYSYKDNRTQNIYDRYTFRTITDICFENERKIWYPDNKKHIPNDLKLNARKCLIWYIGDGGICNGEKNQYIKLSTHCFDVEEQTDILLPQLSDFLPTLQSTYGKCKDDRQYFICIPRIKMAEFLSFIGECPFDEYLYKWNLREYKNKVSKPQLENEKYFIKLYLLGLGCKQIAEVFEVDFNTVKKYLKKNNLYN